MIDDIGYVDEKFLQKILQFRSSEKYLRLQSRSMRDSYLFNDFIKIPKLAKIIQRPYKQYLFELSNLETLPVFKYVFEKSHTNFEFRKRLVDHLIQLDNPDTENYLTSVLNT